MDSEKQRFRRRPNQKLSLNYYRSKERAQNNSSPFEKRPSKRRFRPGRLASKGVDIVLVVAILFFLGYSLISKPQASLVVNSTTYHPMSEYRSAVDEQLASLRNHNKITFNQAGIVKALKQKYPEISQASIELPFFSQKPKVTLIVAEPAFQFKSQNTSYIINSEGIAVTSNFNLPEARKLTTVNDNSGFKTAVGKQVLSSNDVAFIQAVIKQSQKAGVTIASLTLPAKAQEIDLKAADRPYFVKLLLGGDANLQAGQFLAARHHFDDTGQQPSEYLDVRVKRKVYYK